MTDRASTPETQGETSVSVDFRSVFENEFTYVWCSLKRLGVPEKDLKDQTQDVFLTVHNILGDYDPARPLRPWLFGIAYRFAARYRSLARHRREVLSDDVPETPFDQGGADEALILRERQRLVLEAIEAIDLGKRAVFVMAEIDGHAMPEIAAALGVPLNTAYSRLRLAREEFAAAIKRLRARGRA
jgi:RNA polymerase sigma-70 factor (ECF subfamily)